MVLVTELRRRNVFRVAAAYLVVGWLILQIADVVFDQLLLPQWVGTFVTILVIAGFPFVLMFSWAYELTPEGIRKEADVDRSQSITPHTGKKLDRAIIVVLASAPPICAAT